MHLYSCEHPCFSDFIAGTHLSRADEFPIPTFHLSITLHVFEMFFAWWYGIACILASKFRYWYRNNPRRGDERSQRRNTTPGHARTIGDDEHHEGPVPHQAEDGGHVGVLLGGEAAGPGLGLGRGQLRTLLEHCGKNRNVVAHVSGIKTNVYI